MFCRVCGVELTTDNWGKATKKSYWYVCKKCVRAYSKHYRETHKKQYSESYRKKTLKRKYGITIEEYNKMFEKQKGLCAICEMSETDKNQYGKIRLAVDHDHKTNKVRGLLCRKCNTGLGLFERWNSINKVNTVLEYLERTERTGR